jgi:tetratricopeptide (TPR) repeat protein
LILWRAQPGVSRRRERARLLFLFAAIAWSGAFLGGRVAADEEASATLLEQAAAALRSGDAAQAAELYGQAIERAPGDAAAKAGRIRALIADDSWQKALAEARNYAASEPGGSDVRAALGEALYRAGEIEEASSVLAGMVDANRPPARELLVMGLVRLAEGRLTEATGLLERAVSAAPEDRHVLFWAASAPASRARVVEILERYLALSAGDERDRIEAARANMTFYKLLGERRFWIPAQTPAAVEVPLRELPGSGGRSAGFVIEARIGDRDKPVRLLLDTGSTGLFVVHRVARKLGLAPLVEETVIGGGGGGRHRSQRGLFATFSIGELRFADALTAYLEGVQDRLRRAQLEQAEARAKAGEESKRRLQELVTQALDRRESPSARSA